MKKQTIENIMAVICTICTILFLTALCAGCGHQVGVIGLGTGFRAGGPEYGINYGEGLFGTFVTRDGVDFHAELDSTQGFTYDPASNTYKGIRSISYSVAPQTNGYSVQFAKENPEVAKAYYEALGKYFESRASAPVQPLVSDEKSKAASQSVADILKSLAPKAKATDGEASSDPDVEYPENNGLHGPDVSGEDYECESCEPAVPDAE